MKITKPGTKGDKTKQKIIRSAMFCLAKYGDRDTTFQRIADKANLSQPLVVHYFKKREEIFPTVLGTMLESARTQTMEHLLKLSTAKEKLAGYLAVSLRIFREPMTASIYLTLYNFAAYSQRYKDINTKIKDVAVARISSLIEEGIKRGEFRNVDLPITAKTIHNNLTGMLLNISTENQRFSDKEALAALERSVFDMIENQN